MPKRPPIQLLNNQENVQEHHSPDTTEWTSLSQQHQAVRIHYDHNNLSGREELYWVSNAILLRTIHSDVKADDNSSATNLAGHITLAYKLLGENSLTFEDGRVVVMTPNDLLLGYSDKSENIIDQTAAGNAYALVTLAIRPQALLDEPLLLDTEALPESIAELLESSSTIRQVTQLYNINESCQRCLLELLNCPLSGSLRRSYMHAKTLELLSLTLDLLNQEESRQYRQNIKSDDRDTLQRLQQYLQENYRKAPAIAELAKHAGMSEAKLKRSFKSEFGITIGERLQQLRMNEALRLLQIQSGNVSQIAHELGYEHASNFITAFKRRYGMTPKAFQLSQLARD